MFNNLFVCLLCVVCARPTIANYKLEWFEMRKLLSFLLAFIMHICEQINFFALLSLLTYLLYHASCEK